MALAAVLSAMRELILDIDSIPYIESDRQTSYANWFPDLAPEELEDLAKIPPKKLKIYTATIFTGESSVFKNHFKMTIKILDKAWQELNLSPLNLVQFTKLVHKKRPWKSYQTQNLVDNFQQVIANDLPDLIQAYPYLPDLALVEATAVKIKRKPDTDQTKNAVTLSEILDKTVQELMSLKLSVKPSCHFLTLNFDVYNSYYMFYTKQVGFNEPEESLNYVLGSRNSDNEVRWTRVSQAIFDLLKTQREVLLGTLAEAFLSDCPSDAALEDNFQEFIKLVVLLENNAAIALAVVS